MLYLTGHKVPPSARGCNNVHRLSTVKPHKSNPLNVTCYAYDKLHRVTSISYPSGSYSGATPTKTFVYDSATVNGVVMANTGGRLAEAYTGSSTSPTTDIGFVYSVRGELTEIWESTPNSGGYYHPTAAFWPNGALSNLWISKIPSISYGADGEGRISTVSASSGTNPVTATSYNVASQLTNATFGSGDTVSFTYDSNTGRMTQYNLAINATDTYGNLTWNANGTLQKLVIADPFNSADAQTCTYLYDDLGRIGLPPGSTGKSVDCGASIWQQDFSYDAFGNLTKTIPSGGTGISWQPSYSSSSNRYTAIPGGSYSYDANGNLTNDSFHTYTWDAEGRPVTVDSLGLTYDALGRMVEVKNGTNYTQYVWWPSSQKFVIMNGQNLSSAFVPLPGGAEVKYLSSGLSVYRMPDWLGSLRAASNPNRTYNGSLAYAPYGERYAVSGTPAYAFTGARPDTVSDEYDFMFRKYNSTQGRWLSPDPAGLVAVDQTNPQTWNRYAYVANMPLNSIDPTGVACYALERILFGSCQGFMGNGVNFGANWNVLGVLMGNIECENGDCGTVSPINGLGFLLWWSGNPDSANNVNPVPSNPCAQAGKAPDPSVYVAQVQQAGQVPATTIDSATVLANNANQLITLSTFYRGGALDAQRLGASPAYGNYVFGAAMSGAGYSLSFTLSVANTYAFFFSSYPGRVLDAKYSSIPPENVTNITNGYRAQQNGTLCHK